MSQKLKKASKIWRYAKMHQIYWEKKSKICTQYEENV